MEIFGGSSPSSLPPTTTAPKSQVGDILSLFDNSSTPPPSAAAASKPQVATNPVESLSRANTSEVATPQPSRGTAYTAYDRNDLAITLTPQTSPAHPGMVSIVARFKVSSSSPVTSVNFQAAVPKLQQLQLLPISNSTVQPGAVETQQLRIKAPVGSAIRLRLRISFTRGGQNIQDQVDFSGFPPGLTGGT